MSLKSLAQQALSYAASVTGQNVVVTDGAESGTGLKMRNAEDGTTDELGERGYRTGEVIVSQADFTSLAIGKTIVVGTDSVFITSLAADSLSANTTVSYQIQQAISGL